MLQHEERFAYYMAGKVSVHHALHYPVVRTGLLYTAVYSGFRNIREIPLVGLSRPVEFQDLFCGGLNGEGLNE